MPDCIFCKIVKESASRRTAEIVYEDADFLVFLDLRALAPGHVLVITKEHYRWVWDVPKLGQYFEVAQKIALAQRKAFGTDAIWSRVMGEEVHHAHIWIFPNPNEATGDRADLKGNAEKIRSALA